MNNKHLACVLLIGLIVLMGFGTLKVKGKMEVMQEEAQVADEDAQATSRLRTIEDTKLKGLRSDSTALLSYFDSWLPFFSGATRDGETQVSMSIKDAGLVALTQRYHVIPYRKESHIPKMLRATVTLEDDYSRILNWLGDFEQSAPSSRVSRLLLKKGQSGNDIRMDLTIDLPLLSNPKTK